MTVTSFTRVGTKAIMQNLPVGLTDILTPGRTTDLCAISTKEMRRLQKEGADFLALSGNTITEKGQEFIDLNDRTVSRVFVVEDYGMR